MVNIDSINFEIAKNCILSGLSLNLMDCSKVQVYDLSMNLFIKENDIGRNNDEVNLQILSDINSLVKVNLWKNIEKTSVLCFSGSLYDAIEVNRECREKYIPSYYIFKAGKQILVISDLINTEKTAYKCIVDVIECIPIFLLKAKRKYNSKFYAFLAVIYCKYHNFSYDNIPTSYIDNEILIKEYKEIDEEFGKDYIPSITVTAGIISQDIIRFLTSSEKTFQILLFDGYTSIAYIDEL